jgi:hypothetical protein
MLKILHTSFAVGEITGFPGYMAVHMSYHFINVQVTTGVIADQLGHAKPILVTFATA